ncbi:MAG: response regulator [Pseudomonadota bacterium]
MNHLLLIDDEPDNLRLLSLSLRSDGYTVATALSGEAGMAVFEKTTPDIVLTDIRMPGMDGIEVLRQIKAASPDTEVIIITGHGDIDLAIEALQLGASDFINKPVNDQALAVALKRAEERLDIRRQLRAYTTGLEETVAEATLEIRRKSDFQIKLIRSASDGIVATDSSLTIVIYNPGAQRIFGYTASEAIGRMTVDQLLPSDLAAVFHAAMAEGADVRELHRRETRVPSRSGTSIPVSFSGTVLYEHRKAIGSVGFFQDLREIKRLERELVQSERLAAVGQTVAGLAHCIKNILHGLEGGSYVVDVGLKNDDIDKLRQGWQQVQTTIGRTAELVGDLLYYSKERTPEYADCAPGDIAEEVCMLMAPAAEKYGIALVRHYEPAVGRCRMDPRTVYRGLLNLVSNAIDACAEDVDDTKVHTVTVSMQRAGDDRIRFSVADTGIGMDPATQAKLFTNFFSTKGSRGTGLGLLVTRKLVDEHGGDITVSSIPGIGTTFTMTMPHRGTVETD